MEAAKCTKASHHHLADSSSFGKMRLALKRFKLEAEEDDAGKHCVFEYLLTDGTGISSGDHRGSVAGFCLVSWEGKLIYFCLSDCEMMTQPDSTIQFYQESSLKLVQFQLVRNQQSIMCMKTENLVCF